MNLIEFLQNLSLKGLKLWIEGERLRSGGDREVLTHDVITQLKQHKVEILQLLRDRPDILNVYPLSYGQKALWFLWQLAPESQAYNVSFPAHICSVVDITAMEKALGVLRSRHPILRTTFPQRGSEPIQQVHQNQALDFLQIDASTWSENELKAKVVESHQLPFDLEQGPVMRVRWFTRSNKEHILLLTIHHIACDAWSIDLLIQELPQLYQAQRAGVEPSLPPLKHSYQDYVRWQRDILAGTEGERLWNYWQEKLAGDLPVLNLPTDRSRSPVQTYNGASHKFILSSQLTERLKQLAQSSGVTFYMMLLAAFEVLLYRYTGQEDILVGSPTSGRSLLEFAPIVGYFVDPVVIRANLSKNLSFQEFLTQVRQTVLEALTHQDYPFALLVEKLHPHRDPSRSPIFQVSFAIQQLTKSQEIQKLFINEEDVDWGGLQLRPFKVPQQEGLFDLDLEVFEGSSSILGVFKYNTDLFDGSTIERMAGHFQNLLSAIVANPQQAVGELPLLSAAERHQLLVEWNETECEYPTDKCIHQLFEAQVEKTPDAIAVVFETEQLTYQQLNQRANQLAHHLQSLGVGPEVLVGICVERSLEMVVGLLGILKAGGAYIPLDPNYPSERLTHTIADAGIEILLTTSRDKLQSEHQIREVYLDADWLTIALESEDNPICEVTPENQAYVLYTSGSTGKPKGVQICHRSVVNFLYSMRQEPGLTASDVILAVTIISFDIAALEIFLPLVVGAKVVLVSRDVAADGMRLQEKSVHSGATVMQATPATWRLLLATGSDLSHLKIICGGETLSSELAEKLLDLGASVWNLYGPTETTIWSAVCRIKKQYDRAKSISEPIGRPIANTQIYILDRHLQPVPIGVPGELYIGGAGLARGYLNRPELTAEKFIPNPFCDTKSERLYQTGDLARYLSDGNIEYLGRIDNQLKIRGFRIELGEIETVLNRHPQIQQAVVIAREDSSGNQRLIAYLVSEKETLSSSQIREYLKQKLPEYMVPSAFVSLDSLPLTPNGKIDRKALAALEGEIIRTQEYIAPRTIIELQMTQIWSSLLNIPLVGVQDNFFELGGHSLLAVRLMSQIQQHFHSNLPLATLFQNPTIEQLAHLLHSSADSLPWSALVPIKSNGNQPPLFCIHPAGGNVLCYHALASYLNSEQPVYGLQPVGFDPQNQPHTSIEQMATHYIQELQTVQPHGPYFLSGWSLGGLIAFEMAQQLSQQGEQIALLALLDTYPPSTTSQEPEDDAALLVNLLKEDLALSLEQLRQFGPDEQLIYVMEKGKQKNLFTEDLNLVQVRHFLKIYKINAQGGQNYQPQYYSGSIVLFSASETDAEIQSGWSKLVEHIETYVVPGNHQKMIEQPHVKVLAEKLQKSLDQARTNHL